jgi:diacylglycerol kinase (ATP)
VTRRIAVLVNPSSGKGRGMREGAAAAARLREHGLVVDEMSGTDSRAAELVARQAVADGYDAVVAVGGDGMLGIVLQAVAGTGTPLGLVPAGSGNDFARLLGLAPHQPQAAADVVAAGRVRAVDAARAGQRWYAGVLSSGFDSNVNERANAMRWPRGRSRYNLAILAELRVFQPVPFRIGLDGVTLDVEATLVAVGNGSSYGGGMRIAPAARVDDGLLDVTVLGRIGKLEFLRVFPTVYKGTHVRNPAVTVHRAREVTLDAPGVVAYADGERVGPLPVDITCVPSAVQVLVPPAVAVPAASSGDP